MCLRDYVQASFVLRIVCILVWIQHPTTLAEEIASVPRPLGNCVLEDVGYSNDIQPDAMDPWSTSPLYHPHTCDGECDGELCVVFEKYVMTRGIILGRTSGVSDAFVSRVVRTLEQMIPRDNNLDDNENEDDRVRMMDAMARKKTLIPIVKGEDFFETLSRKQEIQFDAIRSQFSVCDIIFELDSGDSRQPMEVVEHLLHSITVIGLHYLDYDNWGISRSSALYDGMREAIRQGFYSVDDYKAEMSDDPNELVRVEMQEYGYWAIATWMDLVETYGPDDVRNEWQLYTPSLLGDSQPDILALCESELKDKLLAAPIELDDYYTDTYGLSGDDVLANVQVECLPSGSPFATPVPDPVPYPAPAPAPAPAPVPSSTEESSGGKTSSGSRERVKGLGLSLTVPILFSIW